MDNYLINLGVFKTIKLQGIQRVYLLLREYGMTSNEIDLCLDTVISNDHNVIHIGVRKTFLFSERKEVA